MSNCYNQKTNYQTCGCEVGVTGSDQCGLPSKDRYGCKKGGWNAALCPNPAGDLNAVDLRENYGAFSLRAAVKSPFNCDCECGGSCGGDVPGV
jgi:hypothetical protein